MWRIILKLYTVYKIGVDDISWHLLPVCVFFDYDSAFRFVDSKNKRPIVSDNPDSKFNYYFSVEDDSNV